jgi:dipeptidase E
MKLYLSSYRIPTPSDLAQLLGKPLDEISVALIPNAKDYYVERAREFKVNDLVAYMQQLGLKVEVVDLRDYDNVDTLKEKLTGHDLIWAMGGNTYMLRYEMRRSGFEKIIAELLDRGIVFGGDSAGALVAGRSIAGVESADEPEFAEEVIQDGLGLVPFAILPHVDNPEFTDVLPIFRNIHQGKNDVVELKDSQAVIFDGENHRIVEGKGIKE